MHGFYNICSLWHGQIRLFSPSGTPLHPRRLDFDWRMHVFPFTAGYPNVQYFILLIGRNLSHRGKNSASQSRVFVDQGSTSVPGTLFRLMRSAYMINGSIWSYFMSPYWRSSAEPWSMQAFRDYRTFLCFHKLYNSLAWAFQWLKYKIQLLHETVWWYIWFGTHQATFLNNQSIWILLFWDNSHILEWYFSFEPSYHWY